MKSVYNPVSNSSSFEAASSSSEVSKTGRFSPLLGNYGKSQAAPLRIKDLGQVDPETGELVSSSKKDPSLARLERWALLSVARDLLPKSQTAKCYRVRRAVNVSVLYSEQTEAAHLGGLCTCHSVWSCPVCAAKISERRREDLQAAMDEAKAQGLHCYLLTLTHPHSRSDALPDLVTAEQDAMSRFQGARATKRAFSLLGRVGQVRAWEVTHGRKRESGSHGWHPHFHVLLVCDRPLSREDRQAGEDALYVQWARACVRAGLEAPSTGYGCRLDDGAKAADYVSKWGLESVDTWGLASEMTKGHIKRAGDKGETPFDLLRSIFADDGDRQARWLFREYAASFRGKRQLVWSRGLRDLLGLDADPTDEELAAEQREDAVVLSLLDPGQWRAVVRCAAQGELLELARRGSAEVVERFVSSLCAV